MQVKKSFFSNNGGDRLLETSVALNQQAAAGCWGASKSSEEI
jgi:hypothetical protein